ncbi:MAG: universal stress protein [Deltaproteobacteria bacterium]|nr:universal stress protein [Deltaproteobacteria bacterium]
MKRFKNILLFAGSEGWKDAALEQALTLVKRNKAKLKIVDVVEDLPREIRVRITVKSALETQELVINKRKNKLEQLIKPMRKDGVYVRAKVLIGTPFLEIIREVLRDKHDLVIKTARGKGGLKEILFGSTAMHLMRKCPCPVWVIKPTHHKKYARIMAAVDPDPSDEAKNALNTKIMELATSMASLEGSEFHVVHAWTLYTEKKLASWRGDLSKSEVDSWARETRKLHKSQLAKLVEKHAPGNPNDRIHLLNGDAGILIPALARRKRIELIVMGTVCRTGIEGLFIGNTAEKVLQRVDCSVLTVKPDGFVTPVGL